MSSGMAFTACVTFATFLFASASQEEHHAMTHAHGEHNRSKAPKHLFRMDPLSQRISELDDRSAAADLKRITDEARQELEEMKQKEKQKKQLPTEGPAWNQDEIDRVRTECLQCVIKAGNSATKTEEAAALKVCTETCDAKMAEAEAAKKAASSSIFGTASSSSGEDAGGQLIMVGVAAGLLSLVAILVGCGWWFLIRPRRTNRAYETHDFPDEDEQMSRSPQSDNSYATGKGSSAIATRVGGEANTEAPSVMESLLEETGLAGLLSNGDSEGEEYDAHKTQGQVEQQGTTRGAGSQKSFAGSQKSAAGVGGFSAVTFA